MNECQLCGFPAVVRFIIYVPLYRCHLLCSKCAWVQLGTAPAVMWLAMESNAAGADVVAEAEAILSEAV